jgi:predicted histone-like DNA-binding protein
MAIRYKAVAQKQPGVKGGGETKYYARICDRQKVTIKRLADEIGSATIINRVDFRANVLAMLDHISRNLREGRSIHLDDFGIFSLSITSKPSDTPENVTAADITGIHIQFRPAPEFKRLLSEVKFEKTR